MEITLPNLYPHQEHFVNRLRTSLAKHRRVIACGRTGFGKSICAKWIAGKTAEKGGKVLVAVHQRGLVDNLSQAFSKSPELRHGIVMSQEETRANMPIQIASIDTMLSWYCEGDYDGPQFDLIIFDECHSHHTKLARFLKYHDKQQETYLIGLSATPEAKGLSDVYRDIVTGPEALWLERRGFASPFRYLCGKKGRLDLLVKQGLRFTDDSQDAAMQGLQGDFVRDWVKHGWPRPTVGFFSRLSHAREAKEHLEAEGIEVAYVDAQTSDDDRRKTFRDLDEGRISYITNVGIVERGTNIPSIACIQLCLAIGDRKRFLQMLGRGSRVAEGKEDCLVIDHGGNMRHGIYTDEPRWTLDQSEKKVKDQAVKATIECPQCQAIYRGGKCRACGYEPTAGERKSQGLKFDGSELVEWKPPKLQLREMPPEKIMIDCLYRAARSNRTYRQACGMAKREAEQRGQKMVWPKRLEIGGRSISLLRYGDPRQNRHVADIFPWMAQ
jgi:DNA repair protein RadD